MRELRTIRKDDRSAPKALRYGNSELFDVYRVSDFPEVKSLVHDLFLEMREGGLVPSQTTYARRFRENLRLTVLNLCAVYLTDPMKYVAYHRSKQAYEKGSRYHTLGVSYRYFVEKIIKGFLEPRGYIEGKKGHQFSDSRRVSRMRPTKRFVDRLIEKHNITLPMIQYDDRRPLLVLRDSEGKDLPFEDDAFTLKAKENLELINKVYDQNVILLACSNQDLKLLNDELNKHPDPAKRRGGSVDFTRTRVRRIFNNGTWQQGGRYYGGWWQRVIHKKPFRFRQHITINGMPTVEPDFSGLHIHMLYAMEGIQMSESDAYWLDGFSNDDTFRSFVKRMLLVMVNAGSMSEVRSVLHEEVHYKKTLKLPAEIPSTRAKDIDPIRTAFENRHEPIAHYFSSGKGIDLQYWDSVLAEYIMVHFAEQGVPCLPVHDSFVIDFRYEDELIQVMQKGFKALFKQECGLGIKHSTGVYDLEWTFVHYLKWMDGEYTDEDAERDEMWLNTHFSRYNQLLEQFANAKSVELEQPVLREIPQEVLNQMRNMVDSYKAKRGKPAPPGTPLSPVSDHIENPHRIKMVTPTAMKQFKLLRDRASQS